MKEEKEHLTLARVELAIFGFVIILGMSWDKLVNRLWNGVVKAYTNALTTGPQSQSLFCLIWKNSYLNTYEEGAFETKLPSFFLSLLEPEDLFSSSNSSGHSIYFPH